MNEYDDILNRIVEEFYDTGRLVLNENYWDETVEIFSNLKNKPQTVDELLGRYEKISGGVYGYLIGKLDDILVNNQIAVLDFIEGLKSGNIDIDEYKEDGVIFPEEETSEEIFDNDLDGSEEETDEFPTEEPTSDDASTEETDEVNVYYDPDNVSPPLENEITRSIRIEKENDTELLPLSKNYTGDRESKLYKSNLKLLQYILLKGIWGKVPFYKLTDEAENELIEEINNGVFGERTKILLEEFQKWGISSEYYKGISFSDEGMVKPNYNKESADEHFNRVKGTVDGWTWNKLMEVMDKREMSKLNNIIKDEDTIDRINDIAEIKIKDKNKDTYDESKKNMFKSLSLKLFSNLSNNKVYKTIAKRTWEEVKKFFNVGIDRVNKINELEKQREKLIKDNPEIGKGILRVKFDKEIEGLKKHSDKVGEEPIEFWKSYKDRWDEIQRRTDQNFDKEGKLKDLQKEYIDYRESKNPSNESIFEDLISELKDGLRDRKLSITDINTILHNTNDAIYNVFDTDRTESTKQNKIRGIIKNILNKVKNQDYVNVFTVVDLLQKINVKKLNYDLYEKSFCECDGDYFKGCGSKKGDQSKLFDTSIVEIKKYLGGVYSGATVSYASESIYNLIMEEETTVADKYDIVSKSAVTLTNNVVIPKDKKIEVKKYFNGTENTLSEFIGLYKKSEDIENYKNLNGNFYKRYNEIIEGVVELLTGDTGVELANSFKNETDNDNRLFGIFVDDYQFYKYDQIDLFWSTDSNQKRFKDEFRITLKFKIRDGETPSQWVEGNCNLQQNESTDRLDEIIENFFDTGKFVI